jgi:HlyD family secretion protein
MTANAPSTGIRASIRAHLLIGLVVVTLLAGGLGGWASTVELSGALIAPGAIVVDTNVKKVQHPTGGVIGELRARDGDVVKAGDVVVRLDDTATKAGLAIVTKSLNGLLARAARLEAEQRGATEVTFPTSLLEQVTDPEVSTVINSEAKLFEVRSSGRANIKAQLRERIAQLKQEVSGLSAQEAAKIAEHTLIQRELVGVRLLFTQNLVGISRLTLLERDSARISGEQGQFLAAKAQVMGKITETELQIIQIDKDLVSEASKDLRETNEKIGELVERKITAEDQLRRINIRAPLDGTVLQSSVHTVGGVISAADVIMLIVPGADALSVEVRVNPHDIDQVKIGQPALLRFSALNQRTTPELNGIVSRVSPDITTDQRTGLNHYVVRASLPPEEVTRLGTVKLIPGMPVEAFIQTGNRTMMSYLMKPLHDHLMRAFREK